MNKVLVKISYTYGKGDGEELDDQFVIEDTEEKREEILEDLNTEDISEEEKERFIKSIEDCIYFDIHDDWDSPTGCVVEITTYEKEKTTIENIYKDNIEKLNEMFESEEI